MDHSQRREYFGSDDTPEMHGIALVPRMHCAFISEGLSDHVAVFA